MKKILLLLLILFGIAGCTISEPVTTEIIAAENQPYVYELQEWEKYDTLTTISEEGVMSKATRNKNQKTASLTYISRYGDDEEIIIKEGRKVSTIPFFMLTSCRLHATSFDTQLVQPDESSDADFWNLFLKTFEVTEVNLLFVDKETEKHIAFCIVNGTGWDDIHFEFVKEYPPEIILSPFDPTQPLTETRMLEVDKLIVEQTLEGNWEVGDKQLK